MLPPERIVAQLSTVAATVTSAVPEARLHNHVGLCTDIICSTALLEDANAQVAAGGRFSAEISTLLHKIKTRISSLLQSRTDPARWVGLCLVKAGIETSPTFLQGVGQWIPMLLKMVNRPEQGPITERAIAVLTRIFVLTTSKPALTRELTSPHLPTFAQYLLSPAVASGDNLVPVLHSISQILKTHPTTFRPQQPKTLELVRSILFAEDDRNYTEETVQAATVVYVSLVKCAQAKTQGEEWVKLFKQTISTAEETCDILFQCLVEEKDLEKTSHRPRAETEVNHLLSPERIGIRRLCTLLNILQALLSQPTTFNPPPAVPLSPLISLLDRLFSVHPGTKPHPSSPPTTYHLLLASYPTVLRSSIPLISTIVARASSYSPSLPLQFLHPLTFTFTTSSKNHVLLRTLIYATLSHLLSLVGRTLSQKEVQPLLDTLSTACDDIIPPPPPVIITKEPVSTPNSMLLTQPTSTYKKRKAPTPQNKANTPAASSIHADQFLKPNSSTESGQNVPDTPLIASAKTLLTTALLNVPSSSIPSELRSKLERTMVLSAHTLGLLAAVLYPATKKRGGSLLPHLVSGHTNDMKSSTFPIHEEHTLLNMAIEATLYPRMQVVKSTVTNETTSVLSSPVEGRFWATSPNGVDTASIDEIVSQQPEADVPMTTEPVVTTAEEEDESYPSPPPPPVPQHATLPPTKPSPQPSGTAMSPPSIPRNGVPNAANNNSAPDNGTGGRNAYIPLPSPGRVHAALPPSPLRQSMSIFEAEEERERNTKRLKIEDGRSPLSYVEAVSPVGGDGKQDDESDDGEDVPEIVMGDSDEE